MKSEVVGGVAHDTRVAVDKITSTIRPKREGKEPLLHDGELLGVLHLLDVAGEKVDGNPALAVSGLVGYASRDLHDRKRVDGVIRCLRAVVPDVLGNPELPNRVRNGLLYIRDVEVVNHTAIGLKYSVKWS